MDWKTMALVVIDMENAFIDPASPLCIKNALATVPTCGEVIEKARERRIPVFFVNRIYRKNGSDVEFTRYPLLFTNLPLSASNLTKRAGNLETSLK